ncbi:serine hydrolase [Actinoplanes cyaneus]|uniref:Serine hydrolase n=1 Tax=Actinoplanes cyaneus TaxID=52696 RepID=A0A919MCK3_9ACTN|nr:serine hydrolase domain-containing protein [Actinoplanes cyaneus]MCW2144068.1 D-alanyl-D-alanine carboxypeptidase [Actinoplanes cyaneus]GID70759.1 serine hydrolase [Actinoplanes cyaneus]
MSDLYMPRRIGRAAVVLAAGAVAVAGTPAVAHERDAVRSSVTALVSESHFPGAVATVRGRDKKARHYSAGVADLRTGATIPANAQIRIGSNTKTFTAVVVLQLVGEGRVKLDEPVETYLPGLVRGDGIDGRRITVRQLLQHTSGLPDYAAQYLADDIFPVQHRYVTPRDLLDLALTEKAHFAPGQSWEYSNTNYLLAGMLIERVTARPVGEEITRRIIQPLGLRHTYFPGAGEESIRKPHPIGYHASTPGGRLRNVTTLDPSWAWAAGGMIGTTEDLNTFYSALQAGRLLAPAQHEQMRTTVAAPGMWAGARYGLGIISTPLSCGGLMWGHGGDIYGYETRDGVTEDGRAASVAVTALPGAVPNSPNAADSVVRFVDVALCR